MNNNFYNKSLKNYARQNRKKQTSGETILWQKLRRKQLIGYRFLRQRTLGNFIVDFLQPDLKLVIEIDGSSHDDKKYNYDKAREEEIRILGYKVIRFTEYEVRTRLNEVLETIYQILANHSP